MYHITQTEMTCLHIDLSDQHPVNKEDIARLTTELTRETEQLIAEGTLFYMCCNGVNYFPSLVRKEAYSTLYGEIEQFIYRSTTSEGDAFISLLTNQIYPAKWACTILLRELYVAVVMQNCQLSAENQQQLIEIIDSKLKYYEESKNIFGTICSPIEDSTARTLLSVYGYIRSGQTLSKEYLLQKVS